MQIAVPREIAVAGTVILAQLIYSRIYPLYIAPRTEGLTGATGASHVAETAGSVLIGTDAPVAVTANAYSAWGREQKEQEVATEPAQPASSAPEAEASEAEAAHWFAESPDVRKRPWGRKGGPKYRVGQVVRDRILFIRGVVVGWDEDCRAPDWWKRARLATPEWGQMPHYLLLVDIRDVAGFEDLQSQPTNNTVNLTLYAPEATLERLRRDGAPLISPLLPAYFSLFDGSADTYVPQPHITRLYPDDVDRHYRADPDKLPETDLKGQPLLRVVEYGRLIAHGRPVPVVRKGMFIVAAEELAGDMFARTAVLLVEHSDEEGTLGVIVNKNASGDQRLEQMKAGRLLLDHYSTMLQQLQKQEEEGDDTDADPRQLQQLGDSIERGDALLQLLATPGVELRTGGPVGLQEFPLGEHHVVLHPFKEVKGSSFALAGSGAHGDPDLFYSRPGAMRKKDILDLGRRARRLGDASRAAGQRVLVFAGNSGWGPKQLAGEIRGSLHGSSSWGWIPASPRDVLMLSGLPNPSSSPPLSPGNAVGLHFWRRLLNSSALQRLETTT